MRRVLALRNPTFLLVLLFYAGGIPLLPILAASGPNKIFEIIQKGGAPSLKDLVMREKDDQVILQGLLLAIAKNKPAMVEVLVERVVDFSVPLEGEFAIGATATFDPGGDTVLHCAARKGQVAMVKLLLKKKASANSPDSNGRSPLDVVNDAIEELEGPREDEAEEVRKAKTGKAKILPKLKEVAQILEDAGGESLNGGTGTAILLVGGGVGFFFLGLALFFLRRTAGRSADELAARKKAEKARGTSAKGSWLMVARKAAGRLAGEHWIKDCHHKTGGSLEGASEEATQVNDAVTETFFPQIASFVFSFAHEKNHLTIGILVDHEPKAIHLEPLPSDGQWHTLPELKGAVLRLDKQKEARAVFGAYAKLLQLAVQFDSSGKQIEGYSLKRETAGWTCTQEGFLDLELTFDDRERLDIAKGKIRPAGKA
jgi:hypothetical protein